jgi:hypothetical protein
MAKQVFLRPERYEVNTDRSGVFVDGHCIKARGRIYGDVFEVI